MSKHNLVLGKTYAIVDSDDHIECMFKYVDDASIPLIDGSRYIVPLINKNKIDLDARHFVSTKLSDDKSYVYQEVNYELYNKYKLDKLRQTRSKLLKAFDLWEKAVLRGRESDSDTVMKWYSSLLDLDQDGFTNIPYQISYYIEEE